MQREELIEAIFANMHQMHRAGASKFHSLIGKMYISSSQMELLVTVKHMQPISVKNIAAHMRLTPGAVTQLMEGLVERGYLERNPDEQDHRVTNVRLAESGALQLKELWEKRKSMMREVLGSLTTEELTIMLRAQEKILQQIEARSAQAEK